jgi:HlyD family secretion protein
MTSGRGPRSDRRSETRPWPQDQCGNAFGPQGAALLGELRRIRAASDGDAGKRPGKPLAQPHPGAKPGPSERHDNVYVARRAAKQGGERTASETITNIREPRIVELRPSQRSAKAGFAEQQQSAGDRESRPESLIAKPRAGKAFMNRAIGVGRELLGSSYRIIADRDTASQATDAQGADLAGRLRGGLQAELRTGLRVLVLGVGVVGGWAAVVPLSAAVMVAGTLVVESNVKKVQHPTGGIIAQILAHDGMRVKEGDLVVRLDEVQARANLQVITKQLDEVRVRIARLMAERDGADAPKLPRQLARADNQENEQLINSELSLFNARAGARKSQKELLRSHIAQLDEEIAGLTAQIKSKETQLDLISSELHGVQSLYDKQLVPLTRLTSLQREAARLGGEREQLVSSIAETRSKISEAELQIIRIDQDVRAEVTKDLRESQDKESELAERNVASQDLMNRIQLRAPASGVVHQLAVHTIGGVIAPGEVVMEIVPDADDLEIQAKLPPKDVDQVRVGQETLVRLSAFNQHTTPQLHGVVSYVSADLTHDKQTDAAYYTVKVTLPSNELHRLSGLQLVSGMPAEVFLQTGSRTMMSYLLKPIADQLQRSFSER